MTEEKAQRHEQRTNKRTTRPRRVSVLWARAVWCSCLSLSWILLLRAVPTWGLSTMRANRCRCVPSTLQQPLSSRAQLRYRACILCFTLPAPLGLSLFLLWWASKAWGFVKICYREYIWIKWRGATSIVRNISLYPTLLSITVHYNMMMMIAFITMNSGLVPSIEGLRWCAQILYFRFQIIGGLCSHLLLFFFKKKFVKGKRS